MSAAGEKLRKKDDFGSIDRQLLAISEKIGEKIKKGQAEHQIAGVKITKTPEINLLFQKNMAKAREKAEKLRECLDKGTLERWA